MKRIFILLVLLASFAVSNDVMAQSKEVDPHDVPRLQRKTIQEITRFSSNGKQYNLIYTAFKSEKGTKVVREVYVAPTDFKGHNDDTDRSYDPPRVINLIYHDLGDDSKNFCGLRIKTTTISDDYKTHTDYFEEIRVPDEIGQKVMDLIGNDTKWQNCTNIGYIETNNPVLFDPETKTGYNI